MAPVYINKNVTKLERYFSGFLTCSIELSKRPALVLASSIESMFNEHVLFSMNLKGELLLSSNPQCDISKFASKPVLVRDL